MDASQATLQAVSICEGVTQREELQVEIPAIMEEASAQVVVPSSQADTYLATRRPSRVLSQTGASYMSETTTSFDLPVPVNETCDRCKAPALVSIEVQTTTTSGILVFCGHHYDTLPVEMKATARVNDLLLKQLRG